MTEINEISDRNTIIENLLSNGNTNGIEMKNVIEEDNNHDNDECDKIDNNVVIGSIKADTDVNVGGDIIGSVDINDDHPSKDVEVTNIEIINSADNKEEKDNNIEVDNHNDDNNNNDEYQHVETSITENDGIITVDKSKTTIDGDEINAVEIA